MRLTKAQQAIVDRMAAGAVLFYSTGNNEYRLRDKIDGGFDNTTKITKYLVDALKKHKVIRHDGRGMAGIFFGLTDAGRAAATQPTEGTPCTKS